MNPKDPSGNSGTLPPRVWLRFGSTWCEGHLEETTGEFPYVPESYVDALLAQAKADTWADAAKFFITNFDKGQPDCIDNHYFDLVNKSKAARGDAP